MPGERWSDEEIQFVKNNFEEMSCEEMAEKLPGRTKRSVQHLFGRLGLERGRPKVGDTIKYLTIKRLFLKKVGSQNQTYAFCVCKCGKETEVLLYSISCGDTKSCGCLHKAIVKQRCLDGKGPSYKGGNNNLKNPLYSSWMNMRQRCNNENHPRYGDYGGRGILVCEDWNNDFALFEKWALNNGYQNGLTIERKDVNGNYEPSNCEWIPLVEQCRNTRSNKWYTIFGETKILTDWTKDERSKVNRKTFQHRVHKLGWSNEDALTTPPMDNATRMLRHDN
jgi:hypothetical protein